MRILVTAGNTQTPLDRVRCITNIFSGRTGTSLALHAHHEGHHVTLLTSHPHLADEAELRHRWRVRPFRTFDDLRQRMAEEILEQSYDCVIHCAAVSDYAHGGTFVRAGDTRFDASTGQWSSPSTPPALVDVQAGKVKSHHDELWLRLVPTPKLVDMIRRDWGFQGVLVKFKLEVDVDDHRLLEIAEASRRASAADLIVANTLDGMHDHAWLGPLDSGYERIRRRSLPGRLLQSAEQLAGRLQHKAEPTPRVAARPPSLGPVHSARVTSPG